MAGALRNKVTLYHDIISPYSWAGFEYITRYQKNVFQNTDVTIKPITLAGIMGLSKNKPPGLVPLKMQFMGRDLKYKKIYDKVPFNPLQDAPTKLFKKGSMDAQRFLTAAYVDKNENLEEIFRQFSIKNWHFDEDITDQQVLLDASLKAGLTENEFIKYYGLMKSQEIKNTLKALTGEAFNHGCFGCPYFMVETTDGKKHRIFGSDRIELICNLTGENYQGTLPQFSECNVE